MRRAIGMAGVVVALAGCGGGETTTGPTPPPGPAVAAIEVTPTVDTVRVGATAQFTAFVKDGQGNAIAGKTVVWTTANGAVATVSTSGLATGVARGTVAVTATVDGRSGSATVVVADETSLLPAAGCRDCLEIAPGGLLLTGPGQEAPLVAYLVDAAGNRTRASATFTSAKPGVVSVSAAGVARGVALGSAQVTAQANGKTSSPILVIVATPVSGALLVADTLVEGEPTSADTAQRYAIGYRYKVRLRGPQPTVGQMLIGTGGLPIFGRVVGVSALPGGRVEAELVVRPLPESFPNLSLSEQGRLAGDAVAFTAVHSAGAPGPLPAGGWAEDPLKEGQFRLGGFVCESGTGVVLSPGLFDFSRTETGASHEILWSVGIQEGRFTLFRVSTAITATLKFSLKVSAAWEGELKCKRARKEQLPIRGFLAVLVTPEVSVGLGLKLKGRLQVANAGFEVSLQGTHRSQAEYLCPSNGLCGMQWQGPSTSQWTPSFKPLLPSLADQRLQLEGSGFAFTEVKLLNPLVSAIAAALGETAEIKFFEMSGGLKQVVSVADIEAQAEDPAYASGAALSLFYEAAVKVSVELFDLLTLQLVDYRPVQEESPLATTPKGFITAPATVRASAAEEQGGGATVRVTLDPVTYLGVYAVDEVLVYSREGRELTSECRENPGIPSQQVFECEVRFTEDEVGTQDLYAFVKAKIFGVPIPVPFEVDLDAKATVEVLPPCAASGPAASRGLADDSCGRVIEGDVIVRNDGELAALSDVGEITGDLWIEPAVTSTDLRELGALYRVGAQLRVRGAQTTLSGLRSLGEVGRQVTIETNTIRDLRGLERLTSLSVLYLRSTTLADLTGLRDLRAVGRLTLEDLPVTSLTALANVEIGLLPVVSGAGLWIDDLNILTSLAGLKPLAADFPGSVWITGNNVLADLAVLRNTTRIRRDLVVLLNGALQNLSHLSGLLQVDNRLSLHGTSITSLDALSGLTSVGLLVFYPEYRPFVYRLPALTRAGIQTGDRLPTCSHSTVVQYEFPVLADAHVSFVGTVSPATATQCRYDFRAPALRRGLVNGTEGSGLRDLTLGSLGPELMSGGFSSYVDLRGLRHLRTITAPNVDLGGNLILHDNPALTSVSGISGRVRGRLEVLRNTNLDQCAALAWANGLTVDGGRFVSGNKAC